MATVSTTKSIYLRPSAQVYTFFIAKDWAVVGLLLLLLLRILHLCLGNRGRVLDNRNPNRYLTTWMMQPHNQGFSTVVTSTTIHPVTNGSCATIASNLASVAWIVDAESVAPSKRTIYDGVELER